MRKEARNPNWFWLAVLVALGLGGCSQQVNNPHSESVLLDKRQFFSAERSLSYRTQLSEIARDKQLSIALLATHCGPRGADSVFSAGKQAETQLTGFGQRGSNASAVVVLCTDSRLLTFRFDSLGHARASYSQVIHGPIVRAIQKTALVDPIEATTKYLSLLKENLDKTTSSIDIGAGIASSINRSLSMSHDTYYWSALVLNAGRQVSLIASYLQNPWSALLGIVVFGMFIRWAFLTLPCFAIRYISPTLARLFRIPLLVCIECLWTLPFVGFLNAIGGGMIDNEWIMSSLIGANLTPVYELVFIANDQLSWISWFICVPFALFIVFHRALTRASSMLMIQSLSPERRKLLMESGRYPFESALVGLFDSLGSLEKHQIKGAYEGAKIQLFLGWTVALAVAPPVIAIFLFARSVSDCVDRWIALRPLIWLTEFDANPRAYRDHNGRLLVRPPELGSFTWFNPSGVAIGAATFSGLFGIALLINLAFQPMLPDAPQTKNSPTTAEPSVGKQTIGDWVTTTRRGQDTTTLAQHATNQPNATSHNSHNLSGKWRGKYHCAQGITALTLEISQIDTNGITALFRFQAGPRHAGADGEFRMTGFYNKSSSRLKLKPVEWIRRPRDYNMVGIDAFYNSENKSISGQITDPYRGCSWVKLGRSD